MGLYQEWLDRANAERTEAQQQAYWDEYFKAETEVYRELLKNSGTLYQGTLAELAEKFQMTPVIFSGFMDGINTSLKNEVDVEALAEDTALALDIDFEKLYYNMHAAKAPWLYELPEWDGVLTEDARKEIAKAYRVSGTFKKEQTVGRNDPCPCGSGKKYKKCCGKA